jgi:hypothetical protein
MKRLFLPLLEFLAITGVVAWWWMHGGQEAYFKAWIEVARPALRWLGVTNFPPSLVKERFLNFLPFIALMTITPGFSWARRLGRTAIGLVVIFFGQIGLTYWGYVTFVRDGQSEESMANFFPAVMLHDALPFVLWAILANHFVSEFLLKIIPAVPDAAAPSGPSVDEGKTVEAESSPSETAESPAEAQRSSGKNAE